MTIFLLIRHGDTDVLGKSIPGRLPGVHLNASGRMQAARLADRLSTIPIDCLVSSPLERAWETAEPIAERLGLAIRVNENLSEVDYGEWSGLSFEELNQRPLWHQYNRFRMGIRIPGGEMATELQARMVREIDSIRSEALSSVVALVSHADPIKTALAAFAGIPLEQMTRVEISPASVSVLALHEDNARIMGVNHTEHIPGFSSQ